VHAIEGNAVSCQTGQSVVYCQPLPVWQEEPDIAPDESAIPRSLEPASGYHSILTQACMVERDQRLLTFSELAKSSVTEQTTQTISAATAEMTPANRTGHGAMLSFFHYSPIQA